MQGAEGGRDGSVVCTMKLLAPHGDDGCVTMADTHSDRHGFKLWLQPFAHLLTARVMGLLLFSPDCLTDLNKTKILDPIGKVRAAPCSSRLLVARDEASGGLPAR